MESESTEPSPAEILEELSGLRDLFRRRLLEDAAKNRLVDELHEQLAQARGGLGEQLLSPVFRALLLLVDRIRSLVPPSGDARLESVVDELLEILWRHGVRPVPEVTVFDPRLHEAVRTEPSNGRPDGTVLATLRPGYLLGTRLLRPSQVVVTSTHSDSAMEY
jgi:molecular chaperone GrpE